MRLYEEEDVKAIMREYDKDDSGAIEYPEFREIMKEKMGGRNPDDELAKVRTGGEGGGGGRGGIPSLHTPPPTFEAPRCLLFLCFLYSTRTMSPRTAR